jgi:hypothetical protein
MIDGSTLITQSATVGDTPVTVNLSALQSPYTVTLIPGAGNTSQCEYSTTGNAAQSPATATWLPWRKGVVSVATGDVYYGKLTALRFTRVSGASLDTFEVVA